MVIKKNLSYISIVDLLFRTYNHYYTKLKSCFYEKKYCAFGTRVKYMFFENPQSESLIVSFPACAKNTAKYNYMRSLIPYNCNKLFLLDDFGDNHQGCYLVEENVEKCTKELIASIIDRCEKKYKKNTNFQFKNIIFIGSSKGGYSALNFSLFFPNVKLIIGAPQYNLGSYLNRPWAIDNLKYIIGNDISDEKVDELNCRLKNRIASSTILPEVVYFHYSNEEHTYNDHVKELITDLNNVGVEIIEDIGNYKKHGDVSTYYPPYLQKTLNELIKQ